MRHLLAAVLLTLATGARAQERQPERYLRFLLPVFVSGLTGAHGSRWQTTLWVRNDGPEPLDAFPLSPSLCCCSAGCFSRIRPNPAFRPYETPYGGSGTRFPLDLGSQSYTGGAFLYVERDRADQLSAQLHLRDAGRSPVEITQVPVVPETAFFESSRSILGVPIDNRSRASLRIYSLDSDLQSEVMVKIHETAPGWIAGRWIPPRLLAERRLEFGRQDQRCGFMFGCPQGIPYRPGYIGIADLLRVIPELEAAIDRPFGVRIEIEPLTSGLRYWPMVTTTNNATNRVTVYTVR